MTPTQAQSLVRQHYPDLTIDTVYKGKGLSMEPARVVLYSGDVKVAVASSYAAMWLAAADTIPQETEDGHNL